MEQCNTALRSTAAVGVSAEPVHQALHSLALLTALDQFPALPPWAHEAAARLTPEQRHNHRLIFGALAGALALDTLPGQVNAYLEALTQQTPEQLRARAETTFGQPFLLDMPPPDTQALRAARALLGQPAALHDLLVGYLRTLWHELLTADWPRIEREIEREVRLLTQGTPQNQAATSEIILRNLELFVARGLVLPQVKRLIFVPSPHVGRYITRTLHNGTLRLFFHAPRFFSVLFRTSQIDMPELLGRLGALGDETRLRIVELFATRDRITAQDVMDELALSQSTTSRALNQLGVFLQVGRGSDGKKTYTLMPAQLDVTFDALKHLLVGPDMTDAPPVEQLGHHPPELRRFLDQRGRVTTWPSKQKDLLLVLEYLATQFEPGEHFSEREVNAIINRYHSYGDPATLRRELCDYGYLQRERDGSRYWRAEASPAGYQATS